METEIMGRVVVEALIENSNELWAAEKGLIPADGVHRVTVPNALVDTGATRLSLPTSLIRSLDLSKLSEQRVLNSSGTVNDVSIYSSVRLTIQGRDCLLDVLEVPDSVPVLIGQVPLELLDFVVDLKNRRLIGNPAHNGEQMYEMYCGLVNGEPAKKRHREANTLEDQQIVSFDTVRGRPSAYRRVIGR